MRQQNPLVGDASSNYPRAMNLTRDALRQIPKVELHRHLECSMRLTTLKDLAKQAGIAVPPTEKEVRDTFLVTEPMSDLGAVLDKFLVTQRVLASEEALTRITFEVIEDAVAEGLRILELRYAPTFVQLGHPHLSFEKIHGAILAGVERAKSLPIAVGLIAIIQRTLSLKDADRVTDFAIAHRDTFVGLDLADNEESFACLPFAPMFERARKAGLHVTVHAGEAAFPGAAKNVRDAIEQLGAERIGHGLQIHNDPAVIEIVKSRKVPLELCPTSNWLTNAVSSFAAHPFRRLMDSGVAVTINSDDPGVFGIDLTNEYDVLQREQCFSRAEFDRCNDIAAANSFIPFASKQKHWPRPIDKSLAAFSQ